MDKCIENVIEFIKGQQRATVTFSEERYKTRIRKLAAEHPEECQIVAENKDGSICAYVPVKWVRINPPVKFNLSDEEVLVRSERLRQYHQKRGNNQCENDQKPI